MRKMLALLIISTAILSACSHSPATSKGDGQAEAIESIEEAELEPAPVATNWKKYIGRKKRVRSGHCVALVQDAVPSIGRTSGWVRGEPVFGNYSLEPGTPIATFSSKGIYENRRRGLSHAALYVSQDEIGLYVLDQWRPTRKSRGQKPKVRFIAWRGRNDGLPANQGKSYYVIQKRKPMRE